MILNAEVRSNANHNCTVGHHDIAKYKAVNFEKFAYYGQ